MSDGKIQYDEDQLPSLRIRTQITTEEGVPDIEIRTPNSLMYIEVKVAPNRAGAQFMNILHPSSMIPRFSEPAFRLQQYSMALILSGLNLT